MYISTSASPAIILPNQPNFRPVGGFPTISGQRVREGLLYRSGDFFRLTPSEIQTMEALGIRMIIDFRSDSEVVKYPTPLIHSLVGNFRIPIVDSARNTAEKMLQANDAGGLATILVHDYRRMVRDHQDDLRAFFHVLATTEHIPLVYHCAAGKDRTGLATYLLLISLGVAEADARADYLYSNDRLKSTADRIIREVRDAGNHNSEIIRPLMEVREEYLDAALEEISRCCGSLSLFLDHTLAVDRTRLQERFLTAEPMK